jgi:hypothetical protein
LACCMTPGEMSSYDKDDRKEHSFSVSAAMGDEKMKFEVGLYSKRSQIAVGSQYLVHLVGWSRTQPPRNRRTRGIDGHPRDATEKGYGSIFEAARCRAR